MNHEQITKFKIPKIVEKRKAKDKGTRDSTSTEVKRLMLDEYKERKEQEKKMITRKQKTGIRVLAIGNIGKQQKTRKPADHKLKRFQKYQLKPAHPSQHQRNRKPVCSGLRR